MLESIIKNTQQFYDWMTTIEIRLCKVSRYSQNMQKSMKHDNRSTTLSNKTLSNKKRRMSFSNDLFSIKIVDDFLFLTTSIEIIRRKSKINKFMTSNFFDRLSIMIRCWSRHDFHILKNMNRRRKWWAWIENKNVKFCKTAYEDVCLHKVIEFLEFFVHDSIDWMINRDEQFYD